MHALFSCLGRARLDRIVQPGMLCAFDFDGTLAPIVAEPGAARLQPAVLRRLLHLNALAPVAVITGRSLADIRARLGFSPAYLIGNHGLEGFADAQELDRHAEICRAWRAQLAPHLHHENGPESAILLEDKRYSLSLHYRASADHAASAAWLGALAGQLEPLPRIVGGKCVINLLPGVADKGRALGELLRRSGAPAAIYVGDDVTDEAVFRLPCAELLSVRVECDAASAAAFCIPTHAHIERLLDELIERLRHASQQGQGGGAPGQERSRLTQRSRTNAA